MYVIVISSKGGDTSTRDTNENTACQKRYPEQQGTSFEVGSPFSGHGDASRTPSERDYEERNCIVARSTRMRDRPRVLNIEKV